MSKVWLTVGFLSASAVLVPSAWRWKRTNDSMRRLYTASREYEKNVDRSDIDMMVALSEIPRTPECMDEHDVVSLMIDRRKKAMTCGELDRYMPFVRSELPYIFPQCDDEEGHNSVVEISGATYALAKKLGVSVN